MGCVLGKSNRLGGGAVATVKEKEKEKKKKEKHSYSFSGVGFGKNREVSEGRKSSVCSGKPTTSTPEFPRWSHVPCSSVSSAFTASPTAWPPWLSSVAGEALEGWNPRRASSFQKLAKIGQGTYSHVYKARDLKTGKIVALKKVRLDTLEPESIKFMAREITLLRRLDHPNVIKLEGLAISRVSSSLYLVFEYMEHDLTGLAASPEIEFSLPQIKCYMQQLLAGLEHCHSRGVLHRDIKGSNLLIDNEGILKIADFGLASAYDPESKQAMTSRVVTLWYRAPELLLGATHYGPDVDLWSAGCIIAELLAKRPILPGRTEVEQLHKIFKLCGSPTEQYFKKSKLQHASMFKRQQPYKRCVAETFKDFPPASLPLVETLLSIDPADRGTATDALNSEFFRTGPLACEPVSLPQYPPSKEMDARFREEESRRSTAVSKKPHGGGNKKSGSTTNRGNRAVPAPEANAELQINLNRWRLMTRGEATTRSEKFPPPHQDGAMGVPSDTASVRSFGSSTTMSLDDAKKMELSRSSSRKGLQLQNYAMGRRNSRRSDNRIAPSQMVSRPKNKTAASVAPNPRFHRRAKGKELEVFGGGM